MKSFELTLTRRVSYIVATKDRAEYLERTMQNIRELKKKDDEVIIIDGLSKDNTSEVVRRHADLVDIFISEKDISEIHAWNKGILLSQGKYIKILSDDDVIYPEAMDQAVRVMDTHPDIDVLLCGGTKQQGDQTWTVYLPPGVNYGKQVEDVFIYGACGVGLMIRRRVLAQVQLLNPYAVANDMDFLCRCISQGINVKFCRINMYHHPIGAHSTTTRRKHEWRRDIARIKKEYSIKKGFRAKLPVWMEGTPTAIKTLIQPFIRKKRRHIPARDPIWDGGFS